MSDTGDGNGPGGPSARAAADPSRRAPDAASVLNRWWEETALTAATQDGAAPSTQRSASLPPLAAPPPPPPPAAGWNHRPARSPSASAEVVAADAMRVQRLEQELAAARDEVTALHEMLEDLPEIFERKFRQRLHGMLEQQQLLLADNRLLRDQLHALQPAANDPETRPSRLLLPALTGGSREPLGAQESLRRVLRGVRRLGSRLRAARPGSGGADGEIAVSDPDDGQPRVA